MGGGRITTDITCKFFFENQCKSARMHFPAKDFLRISLAIAVQDQDICKEMILHFFNDGSTAQIHPASCHQPDRRETVLMPFVFEPFPPKRSFSVAHGKDGMNGKR